MSWGYCVPRQMDAAGSRLFLAALPHLPATSGRTPSVASRDGETNGECNAVPDHPGRVRRRSAHRRAAAQAAEVAALSGDNTISIVDTSAKTVAKTWKIQGVNGKVLGIDVRPADGMLYAVGADGAIFTVDLASGKATMKSKLDNMLAAGHLGDRRLQPGRRSPARDGQRRHQPPRQRRRRQGHRRRLAQVRRHRHAQGREARTSSPAPTPTRSRARRKPRSTTSTPPSAR